MFRPEGINQSPCSLLPSHTPYRQLCLPHGLLDYGVPSSPRPRTRDRVLLSGVGMPCQDAGCTFSIVWLSVGPYSHSGEGASPEWNIFPQSVHLIMSMCGLTGSIVSEHSGVRHLLSSVMVTHYGGAHTLVVSVCEIYVVPTYSTVPGV